MGTDFNEIDLVVYVVLVGLMIFNFYSIFKG